MQKCGSVRRFFKFFKTNNFLLSSVSVKILHNFKKENQKKIKFYIAMEFVDFCETPWKPKIPGMWIKFKISITNCNPDVFLLIVFNLQFLYRSFVILESLISNFNWPFIKKIKWHVWFKWYHEKNKNKKDILWENKVEIIRI